MNDERTTYIAKLVFIKVIAQHSGHGRDVQTEESSTNTGERPDNVLDEI
jgi:hypothetical protein